MKASEKIRLVPRSLAVVAVIAAGAVACSPTGKEPRGREPASAANVRALTTQNGIGDNGLATNGIWDNGIWDNGIWDNGIWDNGIWDNGIWDNGIWDNGIWDNGLTGDAAAPGDALRSNPYARQLLQYIYSCAMPPATYDTFLDPNGGTLTCSSSTDCALGYSCAGNRCVVPLTGAIGVGINTDGTSWGESGRCDESCQRWVSACVLARTNAYGVHVRISMRAPANSPPGHELQFERVRRALAPDPSGTELDDFRNREGAYYGNLFATTPGKLDRTTGTFVPDWIKRKTPSGTSIGVYDADHVFAPGYPSHTNGPAAALIHTPVFTACAGPASNVPEITNRFCSSQGDQVVVTVPGVCLYDPAVPNAPFACAGDDRSANQHVGAIQECYTTTDPDLKISANKYDEVITVFLHEQTTTYGNGVCEEGEDDSTDLRSCPSDCPAGWAKNFEPSQGFGHGVVDVTSTSDPVNFAAPEISVVAPNDDSVIVAGHTVTGQSVDLGGGSYPATDGDGVLAKFDRDGRIVWTRRFQPALPADSVSMLSWDASGGIYVAGDGTITVVGTASDTFNVCIDINACSLEAATVIWFSSFTSDGTPLPSSSSSVRVGAIHPITIIGSKSYLDLRLTRATSVDSQGKLVFAAHYCGPLYFPLTVGGSETLQNMNGCSAAHPEKDLSPALLLAKIVPAAPGGTAATFDWVRSLGEGSPVGMPGGTSDPASSNQAGQAGLSLVIDHFNDDIVLLTGGTGGRLQKVHADGNDAWPSVAFASDCDGKKAYSVATVDERNHVSTDGGQRHSVHDGDVYVSGYAGAGAKFGCVGQDVACAGVAVTGPGLVPFVERMSGSNHSCKWVQFAKAVCPPIWKDGQWIPGSSCGGSFTSPDSASGPRVEGASIGFDPSGNVVLGSFGNPAVGGGLDFGVGTFPTYTANNIFVAAYGPDSGQLAWAGQIPTILSSFLLGLQTDSQGRVVVNGNYSGSMRVNGRLLVTAIPEQPTVVNSFVASFASPSLNDRNAPHIGEIPAAVARTTAPVSTVPKHIVAQATTADGADVFYPIPTAFDDGNAGVTVDCSPRPNTTFPIGTTTVTCTASDPLGNKASVSFDVTVADRLAPVFLPVSDITAQATGVGGAPVAYDLPTAIDQVDGVVMPSCVPASGSVFSVGRTTVTCEASDHASNKSKATFAVVVNAPADTTPPSITVPATMTVEATGPTGAIVTYIASATDNIGVASFACTPPSGSVLPIGTTNVTCSARDAAGNSSTRSFSVVVVDTTKPLWSKVPTSPIVAYATCTAGATVNYTKPVATDAVDGARSVTCTPASGSQFPVNKTTVTCTASDAQGNASSVSFTVWVQYQAPADGSFFLIPIRPDGTSVFAVGRPVPVRFKLTGASKDITNLTAKFQVTKLSSAAPGAANSTSDETVDDTDGAFKYRSLLKYYVYRWRTRDQSQGTYRISAVLGDGVVHQVNVALRTGP
jgi:hypothetical protein